MPNCEVSVDGYPRKLPAVMLSKDAEELLLGILGKPMLGAFRVLATTRLQGRFR